MAAPLTPRRTWLQRLLRRGRTTIPVVRLHGVIAAEQRQGRLNIASVAPLLAAFAQRFGAITVLPLSPRPEAPASRVLIRGIKGSRAPLTLLSTRALHDEGRAFTPAFDAIFRGTARLVW